MSSAECILSATIIIIIIIIIIIKQTLKAQINRKLKEHHKYAAQP